MAASPGSCASRNSLVDALGLHGPRPDAHVAAADPDVILYDPFSAKADGELWSVPAFEHLHALAIRKPTTLYTYSSSTLVRARLLASGWFVGRGVGTGPKSETTIASSERVAGIPYLGGEFVDRWTRSH